MTETPLAPIEPGTVCCGLYRSIGCCDPEGCGPCCPRRPQCTWTPAHQNTAMQACRAFTAERGESA